MIGKWKKEKGREEGKRVWKIEKKIKRENKYVRLTDRQKHRQTEGKI